MIYFATMYTNYLFLLDGEKIRASGKLHHEFLKSIIIQIILGRGLFRSFVFMFITDIIFVQIATQSMTINPI